MDADDGAADGAELFLDYVEAELEADEGDTAAEVYGRHRHSTSPESQQARATALAPVSRALLRAVSIVRCVCLRATPSRCETLRRKHTLAAELWPARRLRRLPRSALAWTLCCR